MRTEPQTRTIKIRKRADQPQQPEAEPTRPERARTWLDEIAERTKQPKKARKTEFIF